MAEFNKTGSSTLTKSILIKEGRYHEYKPSSQLLPYIKKFYFIEGFEQYKYQEVKLISKECIELHIHCNSKGQEVFDFKCQQYRTSKAFIVGNSHIHRLTRVRAIEKLNLFVVEFSTLGVIQLLHIYPVEIFDAIIDFEHICGSKSKTLINRLMNVDSYDKKISIAEDFFYKRNKAVQKFDRKDIELDYFMNMGKYICVENMCRKLHINRRYLERVFLKRIGLCPKEFLRIKRFNKACELLSQFPEINLINIVNECQYFDESHFIHEFHSLLNKSPLRLIKEINMLIYMGRGYLA